MLLRTGLAAVLAAASIAAHAASANDQRFEQCRAKLKKAQKLELLYDMKFESPRGWRVYVGPTFHRVPIDAKEGLAETLNCFFVAGQQGRCMNYVLLDWRSGKQVARFHNCRLKMD